VLVDPRDGRFDKPQQVADHFEQVGRGGGFTLSIGGFDVTTGDDTIGYSREEWVVLPGDTLFVHGTLRTGADGVAIAKGASGQLVISTRSEEELQRSAGRFALGARIGSVVATVIGIGLVAAGLAM
jgi:hypothetical protein